MFVIIYTNSKVKDMRDISILATILRNTKLNNLDEIFR